MLLLIRNDKVGSSFALVRSIVEGTYRGMWSTFARRMRQIKRSREKRRIAGEHDTDGKGH